MKRSSATAPSGAHPMSVRSKRAKEEETGCWSSQVWDPSTQEWVEEQQAPKKEGAVRGAYDEVWDEEVQQKLLEALPKKKAMVPRLPKPPKPPKPPKLANAATGKGKGGGDASSSSKEGKGTNAAKDDKKHSELAADEPHDPQQQQQQQKQQQQLQQQQMDIITAAANAAAAAASALMVMDPESLARVLGPGGQSPGPGPGPGTPPRDIVTSCSARHGDATVRHPPIEDEHRDIVLSTTRRCDREASTGCLNMSIKGEAGWIRTNKKGWLKLCPSCMGDTQWSQRNSMAIAIEYSRQEHSQHQQDQGWDSD